MSFQGAINQALGTASGVAEVKAGKVDSSASAQTKDAGKQTQKTRDFKNFDLKTADKSKQALNGEIKGKTEQTKAVQKRVQTVRKKKKKVIDTSLVEHMNFD